MLSTNYPLSKQSARLTKFFVCCSNMRLSLSPRHDIIVCDTFVFSSRSSTFEIRVLQVVALAKSEAISKYVAIECNGS